MYLAPARPPISADERKALESFIVDACTCDTAAASRALSGLPAIDEQGAPHRSFPHRPPSPARAAPYDSNNAHQRPHARPRLSLCSSGTAPTLSAILRLHPPPAPLHAGAVARDAPTEAFKTPEHRCPSPPATPIPVVRRCLAAQATPAAESLATTRWA